MLPVRFDGLHRGGVVIAFMLLCQSGQGNRMDSAQRPHRRIRLDTRAKRCRGIRAFRQATHLGTDWRLAVVQVFS